MLHNKIAKICQQAAVLKTNTNIKIILDHAEMNSFETYIFYHGNEVITNINPL